MILDTINSTIGGDEYISLPVALDMPYTEIRTDLSNDLLSKRAKSHASWYVDKHSRLQANQMYISVRPDLDSTRTLHELCCRETNNIQFRFSL
jgi:hypothetical protein